MKEKKTFMWWWLYMSSAVPMEINNKDNRRTPWIASGGVFEIYENVKQF